MAIASAGSLCAGRSELPTGALRGFSIVEIRDDYAGARVHVREMRFANLFSQAVLRDFGGRSYVDIEWTAPVDAAGRPENPVAQGRADILRQAEDALRGRNDPREALSLLSRIDMESDGFGRRLLVEAASATGDPLELLNALGDPQTIEELVMRVDAHLAARQPENAESALADHALRLGLPDPSRADLEMKIKLNKWSAP